MAPASTLFQDDYAQSSETEHVYAANKRQNRILDANYGAADLKEIVKSISTIEAIERHRLYLWVKLSLMPTCSRRLWDSRSIPVSFVFSSCF
jgi:hypothetical protein